MREIKFRFWNHVYKQMWAPGKINYGMLQDEGFMREHIPMQFTGIYDRSGKEIYEGDVVMHPTTGRVPDMSDDIYVVEFSRACFRIRKNLFPTTYSLFSSARRISSTASIEIVGNIYESPWLLTSNSKATK